MIGFADRVRVARQKIRLGTGARMTQGDLADLVGVERNTISRWENKGIRPKDPDVMQRLADTLRVRMEWLVSGAGIGPAASDEEPPVGELQSGEARYGRTVVLTQPPPQKPYSADLALRLPPRAYEVVHRYAALVKAAGGSAEQVEEAWRVLSGAGFNAFRLGDPRERLLETMLADIESAWVYTSTVLRREGLAV